MWLPKAHVEKKAAKSGLVAVCIDKDKGSQYALKWAIENLLSRGQTVALIHVLHKASSNHAHISDVNNGSASPHKHADKPTRDLFLTFRCFCTRKDIQCIDVILEDLDITKAITEYVSYAAIDNLVLGASSRNGFIRFKVTDIPTGVSKGAPDFCTVYVISKGKISSVRNASRAAPHGSPLHNQIQSQANDSANPANVRTQLSNSLRAEKSLKPRTLQDDNESVKSPFARGRILNEKLRGEFSESDTDISFISSGRPSTDRHSSSLYDLDSGRTPRISTSSEKSNGSIRLGSRWTDQSSMQDFSFVSHESGRTSCSAENMDEVEAEMRKLKLELKQTMDMYSTACKEALTAKQKAMELHRWRLEEERRLEQAQYAEEAAMAIAEKERTKCRAAIEAAEAAHRIAELESQKRLNVEMKALRETEEMKKAMDTLAQNDCRYRRYAIEEIESATNFFAESRKIGEGGYGPVFKCYLDHTPVAVKVLRPDAAQGMSQFQQEVEVLSCIRHPNMVLLLGACPEYGCLVYEYMANGSLDDCLSRKPALSWQHRFRIAAEIATGLLFLHQAKPEPLVHRDLKPGNILLDHNYVSKISDVGLARLVPPSVADTVTQYRMTSTAGTFCYIDPEYQQTGMLGVKSDVYSLGIMLLQIITSKPPMGLTHHVEQSIKKGTFAEMLDQAVPDWPVEEAMCLAKLALQCAELRRKDRPDLGQVILPELSRLREFAEERMYSYRFTGSAGPSPNHSYISMAQDVMSDPAFIPSGYESRSSTSSLPGRRSNAD